MKSLKVLCFVGVMLAVLFSVSVLTLPEEAGAQAKVVTIQGMKYQVGASMQDNLKSLVDKKVYVTLASGKTFSGFIKEVGDHLLHLEKLEGKDFFDALIRIEDISAVDAKFRNFER